MKAAAFGPEACLSDFALDRLMAGDMKGSSEEESARRHLATCTRCTARSASFASVDAPALADVATYVRQEQARRPVRSVRRTFAIFASAAAVAAGVVLVVGLRQKDDVRVKGSLTLAGWIRRSSGPSSGELTRLVPGARVVPGDGLRFEVASATDGFVAILGLDTTGRATAYVPESGPLPALAKGAPRVLPGSIVADEAMGAERIVAVVCPRAFEAAQLTALAETALAKAGGDPRRVGALGAGCEETSLLIEKQAP